MHSIMFLSALLISLFPFSKMLVVPEERQIYYTSLVLYEARTILYIRGSYIKAVLYIRAAYILFYKARTMQGSCLKSIEYGNM